jgi:hypothetical protein
MTKKILVTMSCTRKDINSSWFDPTTGSPADSLQYTNPVETTSSVSDDQLTITLVKKYFLEDFLLFTMNAISTAAEQFLSVETHHAQQGNISFRSITYIEE